MTPSKKTSILVINAGSSSVKFQVFSQESALHLLASGKVAGLGTLPLFVAKDAVANKVIQKTLPVHCSHETALRFILQWINAQDLKISVVAHRVVHGGVMFTKSVWVTSGVMAQLRELNPLAPLHQPHHLAAIELISTINPELPQIACFDTAFHAHHEALFTEYALPQKLREEGIRRYGFHGLSYEWVAYTLQQNDPELAKGRIIAAHLGNGASLCAMHHGISIDTTLGMTALAGLPMGTRCGDLDPGVIIYLIRELGLSADEIEHILYHESGLLGLSEKTNDVKLLQESSDPRAQFALTYFCLKGAQLMGMMAVALGGVDGIVFTGGIGENSEWVRRAILKHVTFLKPFETRIIAANEERIMAMHTLSLLEKNKGSEVL
ncbi:acetate/propionate family kinase [Legionella anisa]|uniref:Acetate kinase n=1 Tax=Legionella anisa TaxID=28082 RepID=A0AAX0WZP7_9GAMM|nr:acetate/propionate family kinase [Legionella anisa]KTC68616.1 acetate kinase [Legionella anisa]MBN5937486.1 acetate/propionate family kinase [Legionella anisa]PNL73961.1 acetate/propionate family kinase [Legionella anisa]UAK81494.1 acetate/propionate family kinase [Legionella anisa]